ELGERGSALAGPEQRLLAELDVLGLVPGDLDQPALALSAPGLRDREEDLVFELGLLDGLVQGAEERGVVAPRPVALADPEDRLLPELHRRAGPEGEVPERLLRPGGAVLGEGEDGLVLELLVGSGLENGVERRHRPLAAHLR